jgi:spore maturation protein CgeB
MSTRVLILGETGNHCLEMSYEKAFKQLGCDVQIFDTKKEVQRFARFGVLGKKVHQFFPVQAWLRKANKKIAERAISFRPDIIIAFTGAEVLPGTFAFLKSIHPVRIVWYWADPLPNLSSYFLETMPMTDLAATYSNASIPVLKNLGLKNVIYLPFAADLDAHFMDARVKATPYKFDVSFVGSWREEREQVLARIVEDFPALQLGIFGPYWNRCKNDTLRRRASSKPLYGRDFAEVVQSSFLSLNVMDNTNYPAVNMRFFEIFAAGGNQLCGGGPEMREKFKDKEHLLYFDDFNELREKLAFAFENKEEVDNYRIKSQELVLKDHLYISRATEWLEACKNC